MQKTGSPPDLHTLSGNTEPLRYLVEREHSFFTQALETTLQSVFIREASNHSSTERLATAGHKALRVQYASDGLVGILVQQTVNLGNHCPLSYIGPELRLALELSSLDSVAHAAFEGRSTFRHVAVMLSSDDSDTRKAGDKRL